MVKYSSVLLTNGSFIDFGLLEQPFKVLVIKWLRDFNKSDLIWFLIKKSVISDTPNEYVSKYKHKVQIFYKQ